MVSLDTSPALPPKVETGGWKSVKLEQRSVTRAASLREQRRSGVSSDQQEKQSRVIVDSDEEIEGGFSCLIDVKETECNTLVLNWAALTGCEESHPYPLHTHRHFRIVIRSAKTALSVTCFPVQGIRNPITDVSKEETARILRKARRQKRKYCNPIIIN
ncbi:hypothetical protein DKX38_002985 [Salix brachista]|uniref:Uncharacterized protein n=1 Tax=Salix brachista TaxID=2182728 RepID=A0A5N5NPH8_9ROSI|nr:hypothetical protein DKX38_002985 [Salix brachista]